MAIGLRRVEFRFSDVTMATVAAAATAWKWETGGLNGGRTNGRSNKGIRRHGEVGKRVVKATDMEEKFQKWRQ